MKTQILVLFFFLSNYSIFSQITIYDSDLVSSGDVIWKEYDPSPSASINPGLSGLSQFWNFSTLQPSSLSSLNFISPLNTIYSNLYSNANLCMDDNGSLSFYNKTASGFYMLGIGDTVFNSPTLFYPLPMEYNDSIRNGPVLVIDTALTGPLLDIALSAATVSLISNGLANKVDTAIIATSYTTDFIIDASGAITTPLGTFDVLRLKSIKYINTDLNLFCSDTAVLGSGIWINNVPLSSIPILSNFSNNQIEYKYEWITNSNLAAFVVAEMEVDASGNLISGVTYQTTPQSVSNLENKKMSINTISNSNILILKNQNKNENTSLKMFDLKGRVVLEKSFYDRLELNLSFSVKGCYFIRLQSEKDSLIRKIKID